MQLPLASAHTPWLVFASPVSAAELTVKVTAVAGRITPGAVLFAPSVTRLFNADSKVALAAHLLREAERRGSKPKYVLFASWYAASTLLHLLESLGWKYVARLKSNRYFEGATVRARWPHRFGRAVGRLRQVNHEVCVVKDGRRFFVTNDTELSSVELKRHYRTRQQIEEVFRLLKQEFGWGGASAQKARA